MSARRLPAMNPVTRLIASLPILCSVNACAPPQPTLTEDEIPTLRTVDGEYDESRLNVSSVRTLSYEQERIVLGLARATTARYIEARSAEGVRPDSGPFRGPLKLHDGWRGEFFPFEKEVYEVTHPLPAGVLSFEPSPTAAYRNLRHGGVVPGVTNWFTGFLTKVIEVPSDETYTFGVDSDDGTIGTLQHVTDGMHDVRLLWYGWNKQSMAGRLSEIDVPLEAGTYLLTTHYFERQGRAGYQVAVVPRPVGSPTPAIVSEGDIPRLRTMQVEYDERRLQVPDRRELTSDQEGTILAVTRATTARYIEARSTDGDFTPGDVFRGRLSLHDGWREEFFSLEKELYEVTYPLPPGSLYSQSSPTGVSRDLSGRGLVPGVAERFSGFLTKVIEVPSDGAYSFGFDSDDGTIGTLQYLTEDMHELTVLWYDWSGGLMAGRLSEVENVPLTAGVYLLTVHYFEDVGQAGYQVEFRRSSDPGDQAPLEWPG